MYIEDAKSLPKTLSELEKIRQFTLGMWTTSTYRNRGLLAKDC